MLCCWLQGLQLGRQAGCNTAARGGGWEGEDDGQLLGEMSDCSAHAASVSFFGWVVRHGTVLLYCLASNPSRAVLLLPVLSFVPASQYHHACTPVGTQDRTERGRETRQRGVHSRERGMSHSLWSSHAESHGSPSTPLVFFFLLHLVAPRLPHTHLLFLKAAAATIATGPLGLAEPRHNVVNAQQHCRRLHRRLHGLRLHN